jgi:hypothetical protein
MKRRELFRAAAALVGMAALPKAVPAAPVLQYEPTKISGDGFTIDAWLSVEDAVRLTSYSPRDIDDAYRDLMRQLAPPGR